MAESHFDEQEEHSSSAMSGADLAARVFTLSMLGVFAVILLAIVMGEV